MKNSALVLTACAVVLATPGLARAALVNFTATLPQPRNSPP